MITGKFKFSAIALGELSVNFVATKPVIVAKISFVDDSTGVTHGNVIKTSGWSQATIEALNNLARAVEADAGKQCFVDGSGAAVEGAAARPVVGLGTFLELPDPGIPQG